MQHQPPRTHHALALTPSNSSGAQDEKRSVTDSRSTWRRRIDTGRDVAYVGLRTGGMSEDTAKDGLRQFSYKGYLERVVIIGRDFVIDEDF